MESERLEIFAWGTMTVIIGYALLSILKLNIGMLEKGIILGLTGFVGVIWGVTMLFITSNIQEKKDD